VSNPSHWTTVLSDCCYHTSIHHHLEPLHQIVQADLSRQYIFKFFEHCKDYYCHTLQDSRWGQEVLISVEDVAWHWTSFGIVSLNPVYDMDIHMHFCTYKSLNALPEPPSPKCGRSHMKCVMHKNSKCKAFLIHAIKVYRGSRGIAPLIHN